MRSHCKVKDICIFIHSYPQVSWQKLAGLREITLAPSPCGGRAQLIR